MNRGGQGGAGGDVGQKVRYKDKTQIASGGQIPQDKAFKAKTAAEEPALSKKSSNRFAGAEDLFD